MRYVPLPRGRLRLLVAAEDAPDLERNAPRLARDPVVRGPRHPNLQLHVAAGLDDPVAGRVIFLEVARLLRRPLLVVEVVESIAPSVVLNPPERYLLGRSTTERGVGGVDFAKV